MNKKELGIVRSYFNAKKCTKVTTVYKNPSHAKVSAELSILSGMTMVDGYDYRILSHNCEFFSCAYRYINVDTGKEMLAYFYPTHHGDIVLSN